MCQVSGIRLHYGTKASPLTGFRASGIVIIHSPLKIHSPKIGVYITRIGDSQLERKMENDMEAGLCRGLFGLRVSGLAQKLNVLGLEFMISGHRRMLL